MLVAVPVLPRVREAESVSERRGSASYSGTERPAAALAAPRGLPSPATNRPSGRPGQALASAWRSKKEEGERCEARGGLRWPRGIRAAAAAAARGLSSSRRVHLLVS